MKTIKKTFASLLLVTLISVSAWAQSEAKVIAVVNKADWCGTCEKNAERAMSAFMEVNKDKAIEFVANDLTSTETKAKSLMKLKELGLDEAISGFKYTGMVYFFNSETKTLIDKISVAKPDQELAQALINAKKGLI